MNDDIDKRLKLIVLGLPDSEGGIAEGDMDEGIAQIKQVFIDAGYTKEAYIGPDTVLVKPNYTDEQLKAISKALSEPRMTGQEWYEAYKRELGFGSLDDYKDMNAKSLDAINITEMKCDEAAKRASGLEKGL